MWSSLFFIPLSIQKFPSQESQVIFSPLYLMHYLSLFIALIMSGTFSYALDEEMKFKFIDLMELMRSLSFNFLWFRSRSVSIFLNPASLSNECYGKKDSIGTIIMIIFFMLFDKSTQSCQSYAVLSGWFNSLEDDGRVCVRLTENNDHWSGHEAPRRARKQISRDVAFD